MEFKSFPDIKKLSSALLYITQKIHGTNAHILVVPIPDDPAEAESWMIGNKYHTVEVNGKYYALFVGSRTRYIVPGDDNYGFAAFVYANEKEIIEKLGVGRHDGEWAGLGINSGEGLSQKIFVLFDHWKYPPERPLPPQCVVVPVLYAGKFDLAEVDKAMEDLKTNGSKLCPGFMRPEGVVNQINGVRYKKVFDAEETQWTKGTKDKAPKIPGADFTYLLQPIRLEKLLSKDERYTTNYPASLKDIALAYLDDLVKEEQIKGTEQEIVGIRKQASSAVFAFVKAIFKEKGL